jgi:hypothetical protein
VYSVLRFPGIALLVSTFLAPAVLHAQQQVFDRKVTSIGNTGLSITNVGVVGKPDVRANPAGDPSFEYPLNSGTEHLFEAGIWIGAFYGGGELRVSTSAVTNSAGYATGQSGYEFTNDGTVIVERTRFPESNLYSPLAVSHQDLIARFSDRRLTINTPSGQIPIRGHELPLFADVTLESYNWNFGFTEAFTILKYTITNGGTVTWDSVYVGQFADLVVRNVNTTLETGSNFFNKNGLGWLPDLYTVYAFDAGSQDNPSLNTYGSMAVLGSTYRGEFFHPSNAAYLQNKGIRAPKVGPSWWLFAAGAGDFTRPADDVERYSKMATTFPYDQYAQQLREDGQNGAGNYISLVSIGPYPKVEPGESIDVYFSYVAALKPPQFQGLNNKRTDTEETRRLLVDNLGWAFRTFQGEDKNNNGVLDAGEDINRNARLDRFLIPEPPDRPRMRVELEAGKAIIYWDNRAESSIDPVTGIQDFEGYRVYRTSLGDDIKGTIGTSSRLISQWDKPGNGAGFNNGFDAVRLAAPYTVDGVTYQYKFEVTGLLSGWQYAFSVTAFDGGDESVDVPELESSINANAVRVFPGTDVNDTFASKEKEFQVGVYPNPYRVNAAWNGGTTLTQKMIFYNLPARAEIRIYTLSGEVVAELRHESATNEGDTRWFGDYSTASRQMAGGEHAWDVLSESKQNLATGLYLYTVKDLNSGTLQRGKFALIK